MLGKITNEINNLEPSFWGQNEFFNKIETKKTVINTLHILLTDECSLNCKFCDKYSGKIFRHTGCKRWNIDYEKSEKINFISFLLTSKTYY